MIDTFWNDKDNRKELLPEEKYFYLYLLTNPHKKMCGCYKLDVAKMSVELGLSKPTIETHLRRFAEDKKLAIDWNTNEVLIFDYYKYCWSNKLPIIETIETIENEIDNIEDLDFKNYIIDLLEKLKNGKIKLVDIVVDSKEKEKRENIVKAFSVEVVKYMNEKCKTKYRGNSEYVMRKISARMKEGYTNIDDYKKVIDKKSGQWLGTEYEKYLRPDTLFGSKFEIYLNQKDKNYERRMKAKQREEQKGIIEDDGMNMWDNNTNNTTEQ